MGKRRSPSLKTTRKVKTGFTMSHYRLVPFIQIPYGLTNEGKELKTPLRVSKRFEDTSNCCLIFVCFFARSPTPCLCVTCRAKLGVHVKISVHVNLDIRGATVKPVGRTGNIKPRVSLFRTPKARERDPGMVWSLFVLTLRQQTKD